MALFGFVALPFWIYDFEGTWGDVSCFFTEGYAIAFPFFVALVLALATLAGELAILRVDTSRELNLCHRGSWHSIGVTPIDPVTSTVLGAIDVLNH